MKPIRVASLIAAALIVLSAVPASATTVTVTISNFAFPSLKVGTIGTSFNWHNADSAAHTATSSGVLGWNTGNIAGMTTSSAMLRKFAGTYTYICSIHTSMTGKLGIRPTVSPSSGHTTTTFTITLGTTTLPTGYVFDVQKRKGSGTWATFRTGLTARTTTFKAGSLGTGTYSFRARVRRTSNNTMTIYSPARSVSVT